MQTQPINITALTWPRRKKSSMRHKAIEYVKNSTTEIIGRKNEVCCNCFRRQISVFYLSNSFIYISHSVRNWNVLFQNLFVLELDFRIILNFAGQRILLCAAQIIVWFYTFFSLALCIIVSPTARKQQQQETVKQMWERTTGEPNPLISIYPTLLIDRFLAKHTRQSLVTGYSY